MPFDSTPQKPPATTALQPTAMAPEFLIRAEHKHTALDAMLFLLRRPGGWIQGHYDDNVGGHCLVGALQRVTTDKVIRDQVIDRLASAAGIESSKHHLENWNDEPERRKQDVIELVERVRTQLIVAGS